MKKFNVWMSVSDVMMLLMVVFLFILLSYVKSVMQKIDEAEQARKDYIGKTRDVIDEEKLLKALQIAFEGSNFAKVKGNSVVIGVDENVPFKQGKYVLKDEQKSKILNTFETLAAMLEKENLSDKAVIEVIGHASAEWKKGSSPKEAFLCNLVLSQMRSFEVVSFALKNVSADTYPWFPDALLPSAASSSELKENDDASRRAELLVRFANGERWNNLPGIANVDIEKVFENIQFC